MKARTQPNSEKNAKSAIKQLDRDVFGGGTLRNTATGGTHAKKKRNIQGGEWLHVCMRSGQARGERSMLKPELKQRIEVIVARSIKNSSVVISSWQNVGNHLHFSVKAPNRKAYNRWIRSISGLIARAVLTKERGSGQKKTPFWDSRPFTRIVRGWKAFDRLSYYIKKNRLEAAGYSTARAREIVRMIEMKEWYLDQIAPSHIP